MGKVVCLICGKEMEMITGSHLKIHNITFSEYKERFPDAKTICDELSQKLKERKVWNKGLTKETNKSVEKNAQGRRDAFNTEKGKEERKRISESKVGDKNPMKRLEVREKNSNSCKGREPWNKDKPGCFSDVTIQEMCDSRKGKYIGENHPNWQGGISFGPYCEKFDNDLKERVREFFGRCCYVCGKSEQEQIEEMINNGKKPIKKLDIHHVNFDKMVCCNDIKPLFVPLCRSCHMKTNKDREGWEEFFTVSLEYLTDSKCFLPKKRI